MSNKKHGCAVCKEKNRARAVFNYRPFLRIIKRYRGGKIDRETFCVEWDEERLLSRLYIPVEE
jgi:hypothetical protein